MKGMMNRTMKRTFSVFLSALSVLIAAGCSSGVPAPAQTPAQTPAAEGANRAQPIPPRPSSAVTEANDAFYLRTAGDPQISPDGTRVLFTVQFADRVGTPYTRVWIGDLAAKSARPWGAGDGQEGSAPRWSPDGTRVAFSGRTGDGKSGILVASADATNITPLVDVTGTNHPLPRAGERVAWSPDGSKIAFVSATPGPEPAMEADPIVIMRYLYRPASGWGGRFNDNRRLHLFVVDVATKQVTQLTDGTNY